MTIKSSTQKAVTSDSTLGWSGLYNLLNPAMTQPPVINTVTITVTQVELKASTEVLSERRQMIVYPPDAGFIYWGATGVSATTGGKLSAGDYPLSFDFNPDITVHIYAINDGTNRDVKVVECK